MWVAIAATCVTSSMFLTGLAPNLLAVELVSKTAKVNFSWMEWFSAFAPVGIILLLAVPLLAYVFYKPEVKGGDEVPNWARAELSKMGGLSGREIGLARWCCWRWRCGSSAATPSTPPRWPWW
jgi:L-tartrate/succinate antiporter